MNDKVTLILEGTPMPMYMQHRVGDAMVLTCTCCSGVGTTALIHDKAVVTNDEYDMRVETSDFEVRQ